MVEKSQQAIAIESKHSSSSKLIFEELKQTGFIGSSDSEGEESNEQSDRQVHNPIPDDEEDQLPIVNLQKPGAGNQSNQNSLLSSVSLKEKHDFVDLSN